MYAPSKKSVSFFLELVQFLIPVEVDLSEVLVGQICLIHGPFRQNVVELIKANSLIRVSFGPVFFHIESFDKLTIHQ